MGYIKWESKIWGVLFLIASTFVSFGETAHAYESALSVRFADVRECQSMGYQGQAVTSGNSLGCLVFQWDNVQLPSPYRQAGWLNLRFDCDLITGQCKDQLIYDPYLYGPTQTAIQNIYKFQVGLTRSFSIQRYDKATNQSVQITPEVTLRFNRKSIEILEIK